MKKFNFCRCHKHGTGRSYLIKIDHLNRKTYFTLNSYTVVECRCSPARRMGLGKP